MVSNIMQNTYLAKTAGGILKTAKIAQMRAETGRWSSKSKDGHPASGRRIPRRYHAHAGAGTGLRSQLDVAMAAAR